MSGKPVISDFGVLFRSGSTCQFSEYFVEDGSRVVDIGCSTGKLLKAMKLQNDRFAPSCIYHGIEIEEEFYSDLQNESNLIFEKTDIRDFDWTTVSESCSLVVSMFTLQFIPKRDRQVILCRIFQALNKGGAFVFSEKVLSQDAQTEEMMTFCYYDWKREHFSAQQILEKEEKLRHMLKPLTISQMVTMVKEAGFESVQPFWQNFNFVGVLAIKG